MTKEQPSAEAIFRYWLRQIIDAADAQQEQTPIVKVLRSMARDGLNAADKATGGGA